MASEYTKHYYIEGQRIASKIGGGLCTSSTKYIFEKWGERAP
jgi:hypothetical protein